MCVQNPHCHVEITPGDRVQRVAVGCRILNLPASCGCKYAVCVSLIHSHHRLDDSDALDVYHNTLGTRYENIARLDSTNGWVEASQTVQVFFFFTTTKMGADHRKKWSYRRNLQLPMCSWGNEQSVRWLYSAVTLTDNLSEKWLSGSRWIRHSFQTNQLASG